VVLVTQQSKPSWLLRPPSGGEDIIARLNESVRVPDLFVDGEGTGAKASLGKVGNEEKGRPRTDSDFARAVSS
jgi:hypothetical protein